MARLWKIFRALAVTLLILAVGLPVGLYVVLSTPWAQSQLCKIASDELSALLSTEVGIGRVMLHPFNRMSVYNVQAKDDYGRQALHISEVSAGFELRHFLTTGKIVIDYALVDGADITLYKNTPDSPLNIANILDKLRSKDQQKPPTRFDLRINTVILHNASLTYDVKSEPDRPGFDPNHVRLGALNLNAYIPRLSNDQYTVELDRLDFRESSGFVLKGMTVKADVRSSGIDMGPLTIDLPNSHIVVSPISLSFDRFEQLPEVIHHTPVRAEIAEGSNIFLPDLQAFVPRLADFDFDFDIQLVTEACLSHIDLPLLHLAEQSGMLTVDMSTVVDRPDSPDSLTYDLKQLEVSGNGATIDSRLSPLLPGASAVFARLRRIERFDLNATGRGKLAEAAVNVRLTTPSDALTAHARYSTPDSFRTIDFAGRVDMTDIDLGQLTGQSRLGGVTARIDAKGRVRGRQFSGDVNLQSDRLQFDGYQYRNIKLGATVDSKSISAKLSVADPNLKLTADADCDYAAACKRLWLDLQLDHMGLHELHLADRYPGYRMAGQLNATIEGSTVDDILGSVRVDRFSFVDSIGGIGLDSLELNIDRLNDYTTISMASDYVNGTVEGRITLSSLVPQIKATVGKIYPALNLPAQTDATAPNCFNYSLTVANAKKVCDFFKLPVSVIYPISIDGTVDSNDGYADINIDIPYLQQGNKLIEGTALFAKIDGASDRSLVYGTTKMPTKKGPLAATFTLTGSDNRVDSHIDWLIERAKPINGKIDFSTLLGRDEDNQMTVDVDFNSSDITFGEEVWTINPSHMRYADGLVDIDRFNLTAGKQRIAIDGQAGPEDDQTLRVRLDNVELLVIFETLDIDKALIGGRATGVIDGRALLSKQPIIETERLYVENISYNRCVLGNADVKANFDNEQQSFYLDADVTGADKRHSHIYGHIYPATESLDIQFDADRVRVGFMKPFMEAFASDIRGYASGHARLFGTFKYIDMEGDIFADSLQVKIDFTNTWYSATDSIHLSPGLIDIRDVTVRDAEGHTALLNGMVRHKYFKEPAFDFSVTDARNFLCYDVTPKQSPDWYGHVYGNGSAFITGSPGVVNINVNMTTTAGSTFTFVLSDQLEAEEYTFITFRTKPGTEQVTVIDDVPQIVRELQQKVTASVDVPSAYNMDINADITPEAKIVIVMDPVGGDDIVCRGSGVMHLTYGSLNNDLRMNGQYTLDEGTYNFTLQDLIRKEFIINRGSSISFTGDPYNATLDIRAAYETHANLSDLDESFLQDRELKQTNVPVQAVLIVTGEMRQPDIQMDLNFPTLNQDIYRKVRSIVSTREMMERQIIYLLALSRFYTPDYMASTTKGNEAFAVASSTISSQLGNMLGKLSDKWSIAPNLRSDRGDFSDVEVDVALSSRLLNNRLLLNGNFGYRDKSLNTNQFVGDFDIEYLLNKAGTWRLKAYNRYNDQNYYLRTAATTQGIGVVFRRDFDDFFKFLRRRKKTESEQPEDAEVHETTDSIPSQSSQSSPE